jgi:hypothetical protein
MGRLLRVSLHFLALEFQRRERIISGLGLTIDEASLYDRQIRLWGLEAQNRYVLLYLHFNSFPPRGESKLVKELKLVKKCKRKEGRKGN